MTADDAGATIFRHLQVDRYGPFTKTGRERTNEALLFGSMDVMADPTGTSLIALVDMQFMQITITITEIGLRSTRVFGKPLGVAAETEGVSLCTVRGIETLREPSIKEGLKGGAMRIVTGDTFAILDRLVLRLGGRDLGLDGVVTAETEGSLCFDQQLRPSCAMGIVTSGTTAIGDSAVLRERRRRQRRFLVVTGGT